MKEFTEEGEGSKIIPSIGAAAPRWGDGAKSGEEEGADGTQG